MSGFWQRDEDVSSSESESQESDVESESEGGQSFLASSSESEDEEERRVLSEREKRWKEIRQRGDEIKNCLSIKDWVGTMTGFENLVVAIDKASAIVQKSGEPVFFLRTLVRLEDALNAALLDTEGKKKLSTSNSKALNKMKQRVRKYIKPYEEKMDQFRENPIQTDQEESDESDEEQVSEPEDKGQARPDVSSNMDIVWTRPMVRSKLAELIGNRGKKATDQLYQVKELQSLASLASDARTKLEVLMVLVAAQFDIRSGTAHVPVKHWRGAQVNLMDIVSLIESNPQLKVMEIEDVSGEGDGEEEDYPSSEVRLRGSLLAFCERLDDEFIKSLQFIDPHTKAYVKRLKDENLFLLLAVRLEEYYARKNNNFAVQRISLRRMERLYNKREVLNPFQILVKSFRERSVTVQEDEVDEVDELEDGEEEPKLEVPTGPGPSDLESDETLLGSRGLAESKKTIQQVLHRLAVYIYKTGDERAKTRAMLCEIFNHALEEHYHEARDLFLISHLQDTVTQTDIATQILYNRTLVQLGVCAFRKGLIAEAHSCLADLHASGRVRELLAQGVQQSRFNNEKNPEMEKQAKMRLMPHHMHLNLELLDSIHLICAMLLEIPAAALSPYDTKRKPVNRHFRRLMDTHACQVFSGPPENNHDFIMVASNAMMQGDVDKCVSLLINLPVWKLLPDPKPVTDMLESKIREEGLRTFLLTSSRMYKSISATHLAEMFGLSLSLVHSTVSRMIVEDELHASWDEPSGCVMMHHVEPSRLQAVALQLADKVSSLVEGNERMLDGGRGDHHKGRDQRKGGRREWTQRDRRQRETAY